MSWMQAEEAFAKHRPGFAPRLPQRALAQSIEYSIDLGRHRVAQAPCGVGKSYALLVPLIDWAIRNGRTAVVSTAMKSLQDQYVNKDLPDLKRYYAPDLRFAIVKGRANYLCLAKLKELKDGDTEVDLAALRTLAQDPAEIGDMDQIRLPISPSDRPKLTTTSDECPGRTQCPFGQVCFAERAKQKAKDAHIVVSNHSLLITDALIARGKALLPEYDRLGIDEGHDLESYTTNTLGNEVTERALVRLATDIAEFVGDRSYLVKAQAPITALFAELGRRIDSKERTTILNADLVVEIGEQVMACLDVINGFQVKLASMEKYGDDNWAQKKERLRKRIGSMKMRLEGVIMADFDDLVRWIEKDDKRGVLLKLAPISVADFLRTNIWDEVPTVIMSATLAVGSDFSFLIERLGVPEGSYDTFDCESPFDFTTQARTYIPRESSVPDPSKNEGGWRAASSVTMDKLLRASDGRALMLFTSDREMRFAYDTLAPMIEDHLGHRALRQGQMPVRQLAETFTHDEHSVLFALKSFFTGIDVQGDSLRLLVINKLPFPVPSDVINKARCGIIDARNGGSPWGPRGSFEKFTIPTMALDLLQAYGRLIRSVDDQGVVAVLDPRLHTKKYGPKIVKAFPPAPVVEELDQITAFLRSLEIVHA